MHLLPAPGTPLGALPFVRLCFAGDRGAADVAVEQAGARRLHLVLTRDPVSMGDDTMGTNEADLDLPFAARAADVLQSVTRQRFSAGTTWLVRAVDQYADRLTGPSPVLGVVAWSGTWEPTVLSIADPALPAAPRSCCTPTTTTPTTPRRWPGWRFHRSTGET